MPLGDVLCESGGRLHYVYFPTSAIVSLHYILENGAYSEIAGVGNEGMLGISLFMGGETTPSWATVQTAGYGYRLKVLDVAGLNHAGPVQRLLLRYTQALIMQNFPDCSMQPAPYHRATAMPMAVVNAGSVELAKELTMTQELIASMLGVRREGITEAAGKLQNAGIIRYRRGHIMVT